MEITKDDECLLRSITIFNWIFSYILHGIFILGLVVLLALLILEGYMSIYGMKFFLDELPEISVALAVLIVSGRFIFVVFLHLRWLRDGITQFFIYLFLSILFTAFTFSEVFMFLSFHLTRSVEGLGINERSQSSLSEEEKIILNQIAEIQKTLSSVPANHINRRLQLEEQTGLNIKNNRMVEISRLRAELVHQQILSENQLAPLFAISRFLDIDRMMVSRIFIFLLALIVELLSVGIMITLASFYQRFYPYTNKPKHRALPKSIVSGNDELIIEHNGAARKMLTPGENTSTPAIDIPDNPNRASAAVLEKTTANNDRRHAHREPLQSNGDRLQKPISGKSGKNGRHQKHVQLSLDMDAA
jgi:hypothetical protein